VLLILLLTSWYCTFLKVKEKSENFRGFYWFVLSGLFENTWVFILWLYPITSTPKIIMGL